ncbi:MAG: response regulator transcription factor [Gemmatimonadaceae bacterium]|nr:response regulator transcription factor [Gemmatimonadaceae bacterium]
MSLPAAPNAPTAGIIRAVVVDDEPIARRHLRALLAADPEISVVAECATGAEAVTAIRLHRPELVFLDIQMPELDGVGVADTIGARAMPLTVFVTAHDDRALDAFRVHAVDYLLKPVDRNRFAAALARAKDMLRGRIARDPARFEAMLAALRPMRALPTDAPGERLAVRVEGRTMLLRAREIDWMSADDNNVIIHAGGRTLRIRDTLSAVAERLPQGFVRVHRSALVNSSRVSEVRSAEQGEYEIVLGDGTVIQTGRRFRDAVHALVGRGRT